MNINNNNNNNIRSAVLFDLYELEIYLVFFNLLFLYSEVIEG